MAIAIYFFLCVFQVGFCPLWKYGQIAYYPVQALPPKVTMKPHSDTNAIPRPHENSLAAAGIQPSTSRQVFTMENQRAAIQYEAMCQTPVNNVLKKMQKAYGRNCLSERRIYELYNEFTSGARTSTEHCPGAGRPITASDEAHEQRLLELMRESRTWTTDELVHELGGIGKNALYKLLRKNQFRKIASQWLPHELSCEQRQARIDVCNQNLQSNNDNPEFINRIIAINESWARCYTPLDPRRAKEWRQPDEDPPAHVGTDQTDFKILMTIAVYQREVITFDFLHVRETMDQNKFTDFLQKLKPVIERKRIKNPIILMDFARPHITSNVREYIRRRGWSLLPHASYSPDMNPCDADVFHRIKDPLKGIRYNTEAEVVAAYTNSIRQLNRNSTIVGMENLPIRWQEIIDSEGNYPS